MTCPTCGAPTVPGARFCFSCGRELSDAVAADADLARVLAPQAVFSDGIWLVMHADLAASARVRAVADFLVETVAGANTALGGGMQPST